MNIIPRPIVSTAGSLICILALAFPVVASAATAKEVNAQVLLEEAKTNALQRKIVLKQTELDRFEEDLKRAREQAQGLQESLEKVTRATAESNDQLARLAAQKKRLTEMLDVVSLRKGAMLTSPCIAATQNRLPLLTQSGHMYKIRSLGQRRFSLCAKLREGDCSFTIRVRLGKVFDV